MAHDGILSDPIDLDDPASRRPRSRVVEARPGMVVEHRASGVVGSIVSFNDQIVVLHDRFDQNRPLRVQEGGFLVEGEIATLVARRAPDTRPSTTASGSIAAPTSPARVARASRILVEGVHDAELVEKVWGDDLREVGVVVERLDGMDDLGRVVAAFGPGPGRRLGVLLDHLVDRSKESRAAAAVTDPNVMVAGTPFVDIWAAVRPSIVGIDAWPEVPLGTDWKTGVLRALGVDEHPGAFWRRLLGSVRTYADLDPALVGAVESLIDFVTEP